MDVPKDPYSVGWYDFTAAAGRGNSVFSAHVDWYSGEQAVFGRLSEVELGDDVVLTLQDQSRLIYKVGFEYEWLAEEMPTGDLIQKDTPEVQCTMITCAGNFIEERGEYDRRVVVIAGFDRVERGSG